MKTEALVQNYRKKTWRDTLTIARYINIIIFFSIFFSSFLMSYYVFNILRENKQRDVTSIMFLEMEYASQNLKSFLEKLDKYYRKSSDYKFIYKISHDNKKILPLEDSPPLEEIWPNALNDRYEWLVSSQNGFVYFLKIDDDYLKIIDITSPWKKNFNKKLSSDARVYILNKDFKILYRNSEDINQDSLEKRPLVQYFIDTNLSKGQIKFQTNVFSASYGFFSEISQTNLMIFSEVEEDKIINMIFVILKNFTIGAFFILIGALLLAQLALPALVRPLKELMFIAGEVSRGHFQVSFKSKGFGELRHLLQAVSRMGYSLNLRDREIMELLKDRTERVRLDQELLIAKEIQENFLPKFPQGLVRGIELFAKYEPAEEVAGDWYNEFYDENTGEFIVIIADVSGHGAGSSMFTAVIAAQFEQFKLGKTRGMTVFEFLKDLNQIFLKLGKKEWHATLLVAIVQKDRRNIHFINCGHPFPMLVEKKDGKNLVKNLRMPSTPLGIEKDVIFGESIITIKEKSYFLFFTDGIIEAENIEKKQYGKKRLTKILSGFQKTNPAYVVANIYQDWKEYIGQEKPKDDICVYAVEISP